MNAVVNMEVRLGSAFSLSLLRELRGLATLASWARIVSVMASDGVSAITFRTAVADIIHEMWVDWHWTPAQETHIHHTKRVCPPCVALPLLPRARDASCACDVSPCIRPRSCHPSVLLVPSHSRCRA